MRDKEAVWWNLSTEQDSIYCHDKPKYWHRQVVLP